MRHVTWAAAWFLVGLAVVLGTASVLEHRAVVAERAIQPAPQSPAIEPAPKSRPAPSVDHQPRASDSASNPTAGVPITVRNTRRWPI